LVEHSDTPSSTVNILQEAEAAVYGPRQSSYGHPRLNFQRTADLWNGYLKARGEGEITPTDVAQMMVLLKMARLMQTPDHRDSYVDMAGYAATGARVNGVDA
jgi:hypothetical protein